jgi:hypothetical protein
VDRFMWTTQIERCPHLSIGIYQRQDKSKPKDRKIRGAKYSV